MYTSIPWLTSTGTAHSTTSDRGGVLGAALGKGEFFGRPPGLGLWAVQLGPPAIGWILAVAHLALHISRPTRGYLKR
jgi:hypothetical protein